MRCVVDAHNQLVRSRLELMRQLERERRVAALILAELLAVQPGAGAPVARTHHQKNSFTAPGVGHRDLTRVPADVAAVRYARERRTPRERHNNLSGAGHRALLPPKAYAFIVRIEPKPPPPIEIEPLGALEIRSGMFGKRDLQDSHAHEQQDRGHGAVDYNPAATPQPLLRGVP